MSRTPNPLPCGCRVDVEYIVDVEISFGEHHVVQHCRLHASTGQLLEELKGLADEFGECCTRGVFCTNNLGAFRTSKCPACGARAAIAAAEPPAPAAPSSG